MVKIRSSDITPQHVHLSRRRFMAGGVSALVGGLLGSGCAAQDGRLPTADGGSVPPDDTLTALEAIAGYNNYYEFSLDKEAVARAARDLRTSPWTVEVGGHVAKPRTYGIEDLLKLDQEERIYRLRCVEGWSMVIPWLGFPLAALLKQVEPTSQGKYVRFETLYDPDQMPGQRNPAFPWPYVERERGEFNWEHPDRILRHAENQGLTVIARLGYVPEWARPPRSAHLYLDETRTARRCGWWCRGSTASSPSSPSCASSWWRRCPSRCGWRRATVSMDSGPT